MHDMTAPNDGFPVESPDYRRGFGDGMRAMGLIDGSTSLVTENERLTKELAEAHAETQEQARLLGAGGSREAALRAENERLTKEWNASELQWIGREREWAESNVALRAQVRELEEDKADLDWLLTGEGQQWHYYYNQGPKRADRAAIRAARKETP